MSYVTLTDIETKILFLGYQWFKVAQAKSVSIDSCENGKCADHHHNTYESSARAIISPQILGR